MDETADRNKRTSVGQNMYRRQESQKKKGEKKHTHTHTQMVRTERRDG